MSSAAAPSTTETITIQDAVAVGGLWVPKEFSDLVVEETMCSTDTIGVRVFQVVYSGGGRRLRVMLELNTREYSVVDLLAPGPGPVAATFESANVFPFLLKRTIERAKQLGLEVMA